MQLSYRYCNARPGEESKIYARKASRVCSFARRISHYSFSLTLRCPALGPGGGKGPGEVLRKLAQDAERQAHQLIDCLTPKHEYDFADVTLIFISTLVFMWVAAGLYRVYAFSFYLASSTP